MPTIVTLEKEKQAWKFEAGHYYKNDGDIYLCCHIPGGTLLLVRLSDGRFNGADGVSCLRREEWEPITNNKITINVEA